MGRRVPWAGGALQFSEFELVLNALPQRAADCKPFGAPADPDIWIGLLDLTLRCQARGLRSEVPPKTMKDQPGAPQEHPIASQERRRAPQEFPSTTQESPKIAQRASKSDPGRVNRAPRAPNDDPRGPKERPKSGSCAVLDVFKLHISKSNTF